MIGFIIPTKSGPPKVVGGPNCAFYLTFRLKKSECKGLKYINLQAISYAFKHTRKFQHDLMSWAVALGENSPKDAYISLYYFFKDIYKDIYKDERKMLKFFFYLTKKMDIILNQDEYELDHPLFTRMYLDMNYDIAMAKLMNENHNGKNIIAALNSFIGTKGPIKQEIHGFTHSLRIRMKMPLGLLKTKSNIRKVLKLNDGFSLISYDFIAAEEVTKLNLLDNPYSEKIAKFDSIYQDYEKILLENNQNPKLAKNINFILTYGGNKGTLVSKKIPPSIAQEFLEIHKKRNEKSKQVLEKLVIVTPYYGGNFMRNPINGFYYEIDKERNIWNLFIQSTFSYFFDVFLSVLTESTNIIEQKHDEILISSNNVSFTDEKVKEALNKTNKILKLKIKLKLKRTIL